MEKLSRIGNNIVGSEIIKISQQIKEIAKTANVTILNISKYKFEPQGFTILALLAESHISFHTFPEKGIISFDFFTCGKINPSVAVELSITLKDWFVHFTLNRICGLPFIG